jgi:starch synthase
MVASEAFPLAKTGGLADVAGALPQALGRQGHDVTLVIPRYREVPAGGAAAIDRFYVPLGDYGREAAFYGLAGGERVRIVLVDCPDYYDREGLYTVANVDYPDNAVRFAFLARAALELAHRANDRPSVVHAHDWQTGLVPLYLKTQYAGSPALGDVPVVFTIHNLAYQGLFPPDWLPRLGLPWDLFTPARLEFWNSISFLKSGIVFSELITTVSRKYAREIMTSEYGFGFDGILRERKGDLTGILNGIDVERWNPEADPHIPEPYSAEDLTGKTVAKRALLAEYGLAAGPDALGRPVVGLISRLVDQKGFDLLARIADELPGLGATFVLLGSGDPRYEDLWRGLARRFPAHVAVRIGFDERLAHLIEAGSDLFLMPSRFEPCGLNQIYSLRYGTVPVVRATGGLDDTVENYDERTGDGTGFKFKEYDAQALLRALKRALRAFERPKDWRRLQLAGMRQDHSWDVSAREYVKVYRKAARMRRVAAGVA